MTTQRDISGEDHYSVPREYYSLVLPKLYISKVIKKNLQEKNLTYRQAAERIDDMNYSQFTRITSGDNYTIDNLLKALDILDLEITINKKNK